MWEEPGAAEEDWLYTVDTDLIILMIMRVKFLSVQEGSYSMKSEKCRMKPIV